MCFQPVKLEDLNSYDALMGCPFCEENMNGASAEAPSMPP